MDAVQRVPFHFFSNAGHLFGGLGHLRMGLRYPLDELLDTSQLFF